jgi:hypothetical protein
VADPGFLPPPQEDSPGYSTYLVQLAVLGAIGTFVYYWRYSKGRPPVADGNVPMRPVTSNGSRRKKWDSEEESVGRGAARSYEEDDEFF